MFKRGQLAKQIEDKTFAMKSGEVTDVIRTKQGYVILKVLDHQQAGVPSLKDAMPKIQDALYYEKLQPALRAFLTKLREDAYIKLAQGYVDTAPAQTRRCPSRPPRPKRPTPRNRTRRGTRNWACSDLP